MNKKSKKIASQEVITLRKPFYKKKWFWYSTIPIVLLVGVWLSRYVYQPLIIDFITHSPWILIMVVLIVNRFLKARNTIIDSQAKFSEKAKTKTLRISRFIVSFVLIWFSIALMPDIYNFIRQGIHYSQLEKVSLNRLPDTKYEIPFPNKAVKSYIDERGSGDIYDCSYPWVVWVGDPTPVGERPHMKFSCALEPDPEMGLQKATKNVEEILLMDAYANRMKVQERIPVNTPISGTSYSAHNRPLEIIMRRLGLTDYLSMKPVKFGYLPVIKNGQVIESYIVVSMIKYTGFFRKPKFGGVYLIPISESSGVVSGLAKATTGIGTYLTPEQCQSQEYWFLNHQDLVPHDVVVYNANTFRFRDGWWKALPAVREYSEVPNHVLVEANQQPYLSYYDFSKTNVSLVEGFYDACFLQPYKKNNRQRSYSIYSPVTGEDIVYFYDHMVRHENLKGATAIESDYKSQIDDKLPEGTEFIGASEFIPGYLKEQKVYYVTNRVIHDSVSNEYISQSPPWIILTPVEEDQTFEFKNGWDEDAVKQALIERYGADMVDTTFLLQASSVEDEPVESVDTNVSDTIQETIDTVSSKKLITLTEEQYLQLLEKQKIETKAVKESVDSTAESSEKMLPTVDSLRSDTIDGG